MLQSLNFKSVFLIIALVCLSQFASPTMAESQPSPTATSVAAQASPPMREQKPQVDAEFALKSIENAGNAFSSLVNNLNVAITIGGVLIALVGLIGIALIGRQGDKHKMELEKKIDLHEKSSLEMRNLFESGLRTDFDQLSGYLKETLNTLRSSLPSEVERIALKASNETGGYLKDLQSNVEALRAEVKKYEETIGVVKVCTHDAKKNNADPFLDYLFVDGLSVPEEADGKAEIQRLDAIVRLKRIIAMGLEGRVAANLLFNSGMAASKIELEDEALRLLTLAVWVAPMTTHKLSMFRLQMTLGRKYDVRSDGADGRFALVVYSGSDGKPESIIEEAFANALQAASDTPLPQNEIVYAELWNMAQQVREAGGYERMRDTLEASLRARQGNTIQVHDFSHDADRRRFTQSTWDSQKGKVIPSSLAGKISATYSLVGTGDWKEKYNMYLELGIKIAVTESPRTTWRSRFFRDVLNSASKIGEVDHAMKLMRDNGIDVKEALAEQ